MNKNLITLPPSLTAKIEPVPHLLALIGRTRAAIERYSLLPCIPDQELLVSAYGTAVYKCPILTCLHFQDGFTSKRLRDAHLKRHERPFKCEHEDCDFSVFGFSTKATLLQHTRLCHEPLTDQLAFPKIDQCPIDRALNDAIDKGDPPAVRTLAIDALDLQDANTGFLIRAIKGNKRDCALILMETLGAAKEMNHCDDNGSTALHILVENEDEELVASILATRINVQALNNTYLTALHLAIKNRSVSIVKLLLRHRDGKSTLAAANKRSAYTAPILIWAVTTGNNEVLKLLLETGEDIFKDAIIKALRVAMSEMKKDLVGTLLLWGRLLAVEKSYPKPYCDWLLPDVEDMLPVY